MKNLIFFTALFTVSFLSAQSPWPSGNWASGVNLTSIMNASGVNELSGLHWNPENNRLYAVQNDGRVRVLQYNLTSETFSQIANKSFSGGPEGITQANLSDNEFFTIDENEYEIRKYTHTPDFSTVTEARHWNLLQSPSPMSDTGNTGPEGIVFVPDFFLSQANFTSPVTGEPYTSVKGMGGLMFVAHQDGGYIWVFDLNPNVNNDFAFVGKYKTSRNESCDLAFDRSTGLLYILHNTGANYLQVSNFSLSASPEATFSVISEYFVANPTGSNQNIEGFALMPKCGNLNGSAFLCRDASSGDAVSVRQDVLRQFDPFTADGECELGIEDVNFDKLVMYPNPAASNLHLTTSSKIEFGRIEVYNPLGQIVLSCENANGTLHVGSLSSGWYTVKAFSEYKVFTGRFVRQ